MNAQLKTPRRCVNTYGATDNCKELIGMSKHTCSIEDCDRPVRTRGWCNAHHLRYTRYGDPLGGKPPVYSSPEEAFVARTKWQDDCLIWTGSLDGPGYGQLRINERLIKAHRYAWEREHGAISEGKYLDHTCWNKACCNLAHLRLASHAENVQYQARRRKDNTTGYRGVYKKGNTWVARVTKGDKVHRIYGFPTAEAAGKAATKLRAELFGEFAGRG